MTLTGIDFAMQVKQQDSNADLPGQLQALQRCIADLQAKVEQLQTDAALERSTHQVRLCCACLTFSIEVASEGLKPTMVTVGYTDVSTLVSIATCLAFYAMFLGLFLPFVIRFETMLL